MKKYFYIFAFTLFFTFISNSYPQWSDTWFKGTFPIVKCNGNSVFIITTIGGGIYKSSNEGLTWKQINRKPINYNYWNPNLSNFRSSLYVIDSIILLPCNGGALISTDQGNNWRIMNNGIASNNTCLVSAGIGNYLFIGGLQVMYRSSNLGEQWDSVSNGFPPTYSINSLFAKNNDLYAGLTTGIYRTTNFGLNWISIGPNAGIDNIYTDSLYIFASAGNLYRTSNYGANWITLSNGLNGENILPVHKFGPYLFCGNKYINDSGGVYRSTDFGINWVRKINGFFPYKKNCNSFGNTNNKLFASINTTFPGYIDYNNIYSSSNYGDSWQITDSTIQNINITSLVSKDDSVYASTLGFGVYKRDYVNYLFAPINRDNLNFNVRTLLSNGNTVFAGCDSGKIFKTTNNGDNWSSINNGLPNKNVWALCKNSSYYFAGTDGNGVYRTDRKSVV
jgi:photosystem II stability/assembly factor-like uncharacterized protein